MSKNKQKRRDRIKQIAHERGVVTVGALADAFDVSTQTIRRDIDVLCDGDELHRRHGRIELDAQFLNTHFDQREDTNAMGKRDVGTATAALIPNGATLFISIGSTPLSVARALRKRKELTVITNNLSAAMALSEEKSNRIILPGGEVRLPDRDILGEEVLEFFSRYRAEYGIFGVAGVAEDGTLLEFHSDEVGARQRICENSQISMLVLDHTKFGRLAPAAGGNIHDVDHVILNQRPQEKYNELLNELGERLLLAERD